jgi:hypothetical protein
MPTKHAVASWKACRAVELMLKGRSYDQIAREVGYANRGTAHRVVAKALSERLADDIDQLRELELARLDALQASLWAKAEKGDLRAVNACVRIIDKRCRLLGLYGSKEAQEPLQTLVIDHRGNPGKATDAISTDA